MIQAPRRALLVVSLLVAAAVAGGCARHRFRWTPDPRVTHQDTAFVSGGARIVVERMAPPDRRRHPAILVLHPSDGSDGSGGAYVRHFADELALNGYVCFVVHYFDRTATVHSNDALEEELYPVWTATLRDAVSFAQRDPRVEAGRVGAFGVSLGGYMALALGASDRRVGSLVVLSGGFFDSLATGARELPPTLLLHGDADDVVPLAAARRVDSTLARLGVPHHLVVYHGEGHGFHGDDDRDAARRAVAFFRRYLSGHRWEREPAAATDGAAEPSPSDSTSSRRRDARADSTRDP